MEKTVDRPATGDVIVGNNPGVEFVVMMAYYDQGSLHMVSHCRVDPVSGGSSPYAPHADTVYTVTARGWLRMMRDFDGRVKSGS